MDENVEMITKAQHDVDMARMERSNGRIWVLCIIMTVAFLLSNIGWLVYESQFQDEITFTQEGQADADGNVILNGSGTGAVNYYGESTADNYKATR